MEHLYQILKKNIESKSIQELISDNIYTEEYDQAIYVYLNQCMTQEDFITRMHDVRDVERRISEFLTQHLRATIGKALKL